MLLLAIDTSTPRVAVAIGRDGRTVGEVGLDGGRRHAEQLAPAIRYLTDETGVGLDQLAAVAVGLGPGLFTGLRVGITTARTLAQCLHVPVVGVPSLDLVAYPLRDSGRLIVAMIDARRREVFSARYRAVPGGVVRVGDYEVGPARAVAADLAAAGDDALVAGDGALTYAVELAAVDHVELAGPGRAHPSAPALVELATARYEREEFVAPDEIHPVYLRRSDAEIEWERLGR